MVTGNKSAAEPLGIFRAGEVYTAETLKQMTGWGEWAFRQNRGKGLRTKTIGKTIFVRGDDLIEFVESQGLEK